MYKALYESLNAPAVWLLNKIGVNRGYDMAKKFGLPVEKGDKNLALALGGMTREYHRNKWLVPMRSLPMMG